MSRLAPVGCVLVRSGKYPSSDSPHRTASQFGLWLNRSATTIGDNRRGRSRIRVGVARRALARKRVVRLDQLLQSLGQNVRIYLCSSNVRMPQQQLQAAQVSTVCQQVRGK